MDTIKVKYKLGEIVEHRLNGDKLQIIGYEYIEGGTTTYICLHADTCDRKYMHGAELKGGKDLTIGFKKCQKKKKKS